MRTIPTATVAIAAMCLSTLAAEAQPTLTPSTTTVTPGAAVTLTVTGIPGQNFAVLGSSVGADAVLQVGRILIREHLLRVVGQGDVAAVVVVVHDGLDAGGVEARCRVHVGQKGDGGDFFVDGGRQSRQHRAVVGQVHILRADLL